MLAVDPAGLDFFRRGRGSQVFVEVPRLGLRNVPIGERAHDDSLNEAERSVDAELITDMKEAVSLCGLAVDGDLPGPTRLQGLGTRLEETRHVQPDVQSN